MFNTSISISKTALASMLCLVTAGCDPSDDRSFAGLAISQDEGNRIATGVRFLSACPSNASAPVERILDPDERPPSTATGTVGDGRSGLILGAVAATGADFLIELASAALVEEQEGRNGQFLASGVYLGAEKVFVNGGTFREDKGCLVIYRGIAGANEAEEAPPTSLPSQTLKALGLSGQPAIYMEFKVSEPSSGADGRLLELNRIDYAASSARKPGSGRKSVSVVIGLGLEKPADTSSATLAESDALELYRFNLGRLEIGKFYTGDRGLRAITPRKAEPGSNMVALVTEADHESVVLKALTSAFNTNKPSIDEALTAKLKEFLD